MCLTWLHIICRTLYHNYVVSYFRNSVAEDIERLGQIDSKKDRNVYL